MCQNYNLHINISTDVLHHIFQRHRIWLHNLRLYPTCCSVPIWKVIKNELFKILVIKNLIKSNNHIAIQHHDVISRLCVTMTYLHVAEGYLGHLLLLQVCLHWLNGTNMPAGQPKEINLQSYYNYLHSFRVKKCFWLSDTYNHW